MKKKVWIILPILLACILSAYAGYAWYAVRGIRVFLISYEKGQFLTKTYFPVAIVAGVLWVVSAIILVRLIKKRKAVKENTGNTEQPENKVVAEEAQDA